MRRFLQFGVRGLFILILIIAASLAWLVQAARVQRRAVDAIQARRGVVWYDWQRRSLDGWMGPDPDERPRWPNWIIDQFGVDLFSHVIQVRLVGASLSDEILVHVGKLRQLESLHLGGRGKITDAGLAEIERLSNLNELYVNYDAIGDAGLAQLSGLTRLECLAAHGCAAITDSGLAHLTTMNKLKSLYLSGTAVSDAGVKYLTALRGLKELDISNAGVTDAGVIELQRALPELEIYNPRPDDDAAASKSPKLGPARVSP
jgi:hypothetical protein